MPKTIPVAREVVAEAALHRRSVRQYLPDPVPEDEIRELLRLAGRAPSAWNLQPWRFIVVRDPGTKSLLQAAAFGQRQVGSAPVVIVVCSDMADTLDQVDDVLPGGRSPEARVKARRSIASHFDAMSPEEREHWGRSQAGITLGYLLLIAEAFGLATSPMLGFDARVVRELFSLPSHVGVAALVALGYPAEESEPSDRRDIDRLTRWT